ncbi:hypothetical protein [Lactococcus formosensis]|uniref:DUF7916 family protein n=1 Tax=Lactococcus formosensis TaxID=1281486 RepID=UPI0022E8C6D7|nr:hypothetical protein [Lactococcus formosensis]
MKRILGYEASDFTRESTSKELKEAILKAEGRTILVDLAAENVPLYPEVTNGEMAAAFGADLLLLKDIDVQKMDIPGLGEIKNVSELRKLTGTAVGVNLIIKDSGPEYKRVTETSIKEVLRKGINFLSLTAYVTPEASPERIVADIKLVRRFYNGFLMLNPVVSHGSDLVWENLKVYIDAGIDMIDLPAPGAVPGTTEEQIARLAFAIRKTGTLVDCVVGTSQEGADKNTIQSLALAAKRVGADVFELGDAGVAGIPAPENIFHASMSIRGKRHTYVRMARSANR